MGEGTPIKSESGSSSSESEDEMDTQKYIVEKKEKKQPIAPDHNVIEKIIGIFKRDQSTSSSSSESDAEKDIEKLTPPKEEVLPSKSESSSSSSESSDEEVKPVKKSVVVENEPKQPTSPDMEVKETITGIFKRDQSV